MPSKKKKKPFRKVIMANNQIEKVLSNKLLKSVGLGLLQKIANEDLSVYSEETLNSSSYSGVNRPYEDQSKA